MNRERSLRIKRLADLVGAGLLTVLVAPLLALVAPLIPLFLGPGGILFRQSRPGLRGRPFTILKFRTMLEAFDEEGSLLPESRRLTRFGWFLRRFSIDELPQLWNILKGEMSVVGPRPLLIEYMGAYPPEFLRRHDMPPGVTGWAQVNGRHDLTFSARLAMDVWYVDNWSLGLDFRIFLLTFSRVVFSRNVRRPDQPIEEVDDLGLRGRMSKKVRR